MNKPFLFDIINVVLDAALPLPELLRSVERQIAKAPMEVAFVFDADGNLLLRRAGVETGIPFPGAERRLMQNAILTHNHPNRGYFSREDLFFAHEYNLAELRAVAGRKVHRLLRPDQGWDLPLLKQTWESELAKIKHRYQQSGDRTAAARQANQLPALVVKLLSLASPPEKL